MKTRSIQSLLGLILLLLSIGGYAQCCNANFTATPQNKLFWKFTPEDSYTEPMTSWRWDFGDGSKSSEVFPTHKFNKSGLYTVKLTKTTKFGDSTRTCSVSKKILIYKCDTTYTCNSIFTYSLNSNLASFTNSTKTPSSTWRYARWEFGDGTISNSWNAQHTYAPGVYTVKLTVVYGNSFYSRTCVSTQQIVIQKPCNAEFTKFVTKNEVYLNASAGQNLISYWSFGDGATSYGKSVMHAYTQKGQYTVCHYLSDSITNTFCETCKVVKIDTLPTQDSCFAEFQLLQNGNTVNVYSANNSSNSHWTFGNGAYSYASNAAFTYTQNGTYTICHYAYSPSSQLDTCVACKTVSITTNEDSCRAQFTHSIFGARIEASAVKHSANSTWSYGDGGTSVGDYANYTYTKPGIYTVCHTVEGDSSNNFAGCQSCKVITIDSSNFSDTCFASFQYAIIGKTVQVYGSPNLMYSRYSFGDGYYAVGQNASHTFSQNGTYNICFLAKNVNYDSCISCQAIQIKDSVATCNAEFSYQTNNSVVYLNSIPNNHTPNSYWSFGDGTFSNDANPTHQYSLSGDYEVCHMVNSSYGGDTCSICKVITVSVSNDTNVVCNSEFTYLIGNDSLRLFSSSSEPSQHVWSFSDGSYSSSVIAQKVLNDVQGTITVCHFAFYSNQDSCMTCKTIDVSKPMVNPNPASDYLNMSSNNGQINYYFLSDMSGNTLLYEEGINQNQKQVSLMNVPSGTYSLRLGYGNNNYATYVILIQH